MPLIPFSTNKTSIDGLWTVELKQIEDDRGTLREAYRHSDFSASGLPSLGERPQINCPETKRGGLRGIHGELAHKFVSVLTGEVYAVILDLRPDSETAGKWLGFNLKPGDGLFVSRGLGNSFQSISLENSQYLYIFEQEWQPGMAGVHVCPLDPELGIDWPIKEGAGMIISDKDADRTKTIAKALGR